MDGERNKVRYAAMAFWTIVVVLMAARVLLLDVSKIRPGQGSALSPKPSIDTAAETTRKVS
jgi:hypothetical protein